MMKLPPKVPGEHRWVLLATHTLTTGQAAAAAAGSQVKIGGHNLVAIDVGCVDCEEGWPAPQRCTSGAAPELVEVTADQATTGDPEEDEQRVLAAADVIGRSGARGLEIGFLDEDVPSHLARWYATASFKGARVSADEHTSPANAAEELAWKVLDGGLCTKCKRKIGLAGHTSRELTDRCAWSRHGACWVPACTDDIEAYVASRTRKAAT